MNHDIKLIAKEIYFKSNKTPESATATDVWKAMDALGFLHYRQCQFQGCPDGSIKQHLFNRIIDHMWVIDEMVDGAAGEFPIA